MDIQNNSVAIQINAKDRSGKALRVRDCDVFVMHIFTDNPRNFLTFSKRDICQHRGFDELVIPRHQMEQLQSGVVQYTYHYLPVAHTCKFERGVYGAAEFDENENENVDTDIDIDVDPVDEDFGGFDEEGDASFNVDKVNDEGCYRPRHRHEQLIHSKAVVTSIYWRNIAHPHPVRPMNAVTLTDIERLHRLIEREKINREKDVEKLQETFGEGFSDKLAAEIERSVAEDEKFSAELDALKNKLTDFSGSVGDNQTKVDAELKVTVDDLKAEVVRATAKEIELEQMVQGEVSRAKSVEEVIDTKITMEKERAVANEANINDRLVSLTDRFDAYKELSSETIKSEIERAKATEAALNDKIQGVVNALQREVSRAADKDIEHTNLVVTEANRAQAVENKLGTDLETEIGRAKDAEKHLLDEVHGVQDVVANLATATNVYTKSEVDKKVSDVKNDVSTIENWISNHGDTTDELKTKVANLVEDVDKAKADILVEVAKCDAENDKVATEIQTLKDSTYTKAETDSALNEINSSIASIENWKNNHNDNTDELKAKVTQLSADTEKLIIDLANETNARENADLTIQAHADVVEGKVDAEVTRAKAVEKTLEDAIADEVSRAKAAEVVNAGNISDVEANLTLEVARAKAAEKVLSDALDVVNGDVATSGSIKKSLADAKDYTDAEIAKAQLASDTALADTLKAYATNEGVDKKIADVIGTAPEALDTLGKISNALASDSDAITAINGVLAGKADSANVYTKAEVDTKVNDINNVISTLETKSDNADATINSRVDDLVTKVAGIETTADTNNTALTDAIVAEEVARKAADKSLGDKLDAEVEKLTGKISELNATVISDIADSTAKDTELAAKISANEAAISSEVARAKQVETELNEKINSIDLAGANTNISALSDKIDAEVARAENAEKLISDKVDTLQGDVTTATASITSLNSALTQAVADSTAKDSEIETAVANEKSRAENAEKAISDNLSALSDKVANIDLDSANSAISTLDTKIDNVESKLQTNIDNEVSRAKVAEKANADAISTLQNDVATTVGNITSLSASLTQAVADSTAKDSEIETAISNEKLRAETAEKALSDKLDIINGDAETVGSLLHIEHDAKHYTDDEIAKVVSALDIHKAEADAKYLTEHQSLSEYYDKATINSLLDGYATKIALNSVLDECTRISTNLDILNTKKADASAVYTKAEVDTLIANVDVTDQLKDYVTNASVNEVVNQAVEDSEKFSALSSSLSDEVERAKAAEKEITDSISAVNAIVENALDELNNLFDSSVGEGGSLPGSGISEADVDEKLSNYYDKEETNDAILSAVNVAMGDVYTKSQVDSMMANLIWSGSEDEFKAMEEAGELEDNKIYVVI